MTGYGTSRQFTATHEFGRYQGYSGHIASGTSTRSGSFRCANAPRGAAVREVTSRLDHKIDLTTPAVNTVNATCERQRVKALRR
jgi:hypothetical protein